MLARILHYEYGQLPPAPRNVVAQKKRSRHIDAIGATETPIDDIAAKSELPSGTVSSTLLRLELMRLVKQLPGKYFVKLG